MITTLTVVDWLIITVIAPVTTLTDHMTVTETEMHILTGAPWTTGTCVIESEDMMIKALDHLVAPHIEGQTPTKMASLHQLNQVFEIPVVVRDIGRMNAQISLRCNWKP